MPNTTQLSDKNNPNPNGCNFYVTRKKRFCRLSAKDGDKFCAEHTLPICESKNCDSASNSKRIVCPLDSKHTCYAHKLEQHLKICNARPGQPVAYISQGINAGVVKINPNETSRCLNDKDLSQILCVINKVNKIYDDYIKNKITELISKNVYVEEEIKKPEFGPKTLKHLKQASSLIGIMQKYELFKTDTCYIELGAGKGHLSYWVHKTMQPIKNTNLLLIERASHRHKCDNKLAKNDGRVCRIRADIADLILHETDVVQKSRRIVGFAKHLCGVATDLALRCLINCEKELLGVTLAFCCHHKCYWDSYVGKSFFEEVNLTEDDFDVMCGMVSWATCGTGKSRDFASEEDHKSEEQINNRYEEAGLTREDKEEIGRRCKLIINWGRKTYLEGKGYTCFLHFYVKEEVSLENVCLVAHRV